MQGFKKFTLIELLVVVAIIGILASLLLPSLSRARYQAHIAVCASNMGQCAKGTAIYTGDSDDTLPNVTGGYSGSPWISYETKTGGNYYNLGLVYINGLIDSSVMYCPQNNINGGGDDGFNFGSHSSKYTYQYNTVDGVLTVASGDSRTRSSYNFSPVKMATDKRRKLKISMIDTDQILLSDNILSQNRVAHNQYIPGWNIMRFDAGVKFTKSKTAYNFIATDVDNDWVRFETLREMLLK